MARSLRAVAEGEQAPKVARKRAPKTRIAQAAASGNRRDLLVAMRARIAHALDHPGTQARDVAALTRRQMQITRAIEEIDAARGGGPEAWRARRGKHPERSIRPVDNLSVTTRSLWNVPVVVSLAQTAGVSHTIASQSVAVDTDSSGVQVQWSEESNARRFQPQPDSGPL